MEKDKDDQSRVDGLSTIDQQSELPRQAPVVVPQGLPESVFEAFGHHDDCNVWVETPESYHLDATRHCTCRDPKGTPDIGA